jgi:menaquinone-dependent protoporphyrinogen oxidase
MAKFLIVFGTTDGHTRKIADALAAAIRQPGVVVRVVEAGKPDVSPAGFDGIIVAASVHAGGYQRGVRRWLRRYAVELRDAPTAFISVSLGILQPEPAVQEHLRAIVQRLCQEAGWEPTLIKHVAGALLYTQYNVLKRWIIKRIVAKAGGATDTSRDYEYTDWKDLEDFAHRFLRLAHRRAA